MTTSRPALLAYRRAVAVYADAATVATRTGDPRHWKHAKALRQIARERQAVYESDFVLEQIELRERRNAQLTGKRMPPT